MQIYIKINERTVSVDVSVEVYEYIDQANHKTENLTHEKRRHWDDREYDEATIFHECNRSYTETPEQWLMPQGNLAQEIAEALEKLYRSAAPALFTFRVGRAELFGDSQALRLLRRGAVQDSIEAVQKKMQRIF